MSIDRSELECPLCLNLYYEPISLSCGHSYCRPCLKKALARSHSCALCRSPALPNSYEAGACLALVNLIKRQYPGEYERRAEEVKEDEKEMAAASRRALAIGEGLTVSTSDGSVPMPVFELDGPCLIFPQQPITLFVYEPRYVVMVTRALSGSRRFLVLEKASRAGNPGSIVQIGDARMMSGGQFLLQCWGVGRCLTCTEVTSSAQSASGVAEGDDGVSYARVVPFEDDEDMQGDDVTISPSLRTQVEKALDVVLSCVEAMSSRQRQELRRRYGDPPRESQTLLQFRKLSFWLPSVLSLRGVGEEERRSAFFTCRQMKRRLQDIVEIIEASESEGQAAGVTERMKQRRRMQLIELGPANRHAHILSGTCSSVMLLLVVFVGLYVWSNHQSGTQVICGDAS
ncbi:unnamed protein product [Chrysoparadoxa australica]